MKGRPYEDDVTLAVVGVTHRQIGDESNVIPHPDRFWRSGYFIAGVLLLVIGTGPLLTIIALAKLGLTRDPNPNPIGCGILAMLTFWPGLILMVVGFAKSRGRRQ